MGVLHIPLGTTTGLNLASFGRRESWVLVQEEWAPETGSEAFRRVAYHPVERFASLVDALYRAEQNVECPAR